MADSQPAAAAGDKEIQIPEWDAHQKRDSNGAANARPRKPVLAGFRSKLDSAMPSHRRYLGLSRKIFLLALLALVVILIALIVGLAVGLSSK